MFADESFFVSEFIEPLDELHVAFETQGWIFADTMERRHENSESHNSALCSQTGRGAPHPMTGGEAKTSAD